MKEIYLTSFLILDMMRITQNNNFLIKESNMYIETGFLIFIIIIVVSLFYEYGKTKQREYDNQQKEIQLDKLEQEKQMELKEVLQLTEQYKQKLKIKMQNTLDFYDIKTTHSIDTIIAFFKDYNWKLNYPTNTFCIKNCSSKRILEKIIELDELKIKKIDIIYILKCIDQYKLCESIMIKENIIFPKICNTHEIILSWIPLKVRKEESILFLIKKELKECQNHEFSLKIQERIFDIYYNYYKYSPNYKEFYFNSSVLEFPIYQHLREKFTNKQLNNMTDEELKSHIKKIMNERYLLKKS